MANQENTLAPAEGPGAGVPAPLEAARAALGAATTPADAQRVEAAAKALRELATTQHPEQANDVVVEAADLTMRAARRVGELMPSEQGARNDLGTSPPDGAKFQVAKKTGERYRALARIAGDLFEATLQDHRRRKDPVTQTALLKLLPKPPRPDRQQGHLAWLSRHIEKAAKKIRARLCPDGVPVDGTPEAFDTGEVASVLEELVRRIDARREDPNAKQIDLAGLCDPPPGTDEEPGDELDDEDQDDGESSFDANDGTEGV